MFSPLFKFLFFCYLFVYKPDTTEAIEIIYNDLSLSHQTESKKSAYNSKLSDSGTSPVSPLSKSHLKSVQPIKLYLHNVTIQVGDIAHFNCPVLVSLNTTHTKETINKTRRLLDKLNKSTTNSEIKSVLWTRESTTPTLISINTDLFSKKLNKYRVVINSNTVQLNEDNGNNIYLIDNMDVPFIYKSPAKSSNNNKKPKYATYKNYYLKICNVKVHDSGWYSCNIVRNDLYSIRYYMYLNVVSDGGSRVKMDNYSYENYGCGSDVINKDQIETTIDVKQSDINDHGRLLNEVNGKFEMENSLTKINLNTRLTTSTTPATTNTQTTTTTTTTTIAVVIVANENETELKRNQHHTKINSSKKHHKKHHEKVTVLPKYLNISEDKSFQIDCIYNGPNYMLIELIWYKDDELIDLSNQDRILTLNYKQTNVTHNILKFSYSTFDDQGVYMCRASLDKKLLNLKDSSELVVYEKQSDFLAEKFPFSNKVIGYLEEKLFGKTSNNANDKRHKLHNVLLLLFVSTACIF